MFIVDPIRQYANQTSELAGSAFGKFKEFKTNPSMIQDTAIWGVGVIDMMNYLRETNVFRPFKAVLGSTFLTDPMGIVSYLNGFVKPYNVNTVHAPNFKEALLTGYTNANLGINGNDLDDAITAGLRKLFTDLNNVEKGEILGYATSADFLNKAQEYIDKELELGNGNMELFVKENGVNVHLNANINQALVAAVPQVPLKSVSWLQWLTTQVWNGVSVGSGFIYLCEWDLVDRGAIAAGIGKIAGMGWINYLNFDQLFLGGICLGFGLQLVQSCKSIREIVYAENPQAKRQAIIDAVASAAQLVFYGLALSAALHLFTASAGFVALSLIAARTIAIVNNACKPKPDMFAGQVTNEAPEQSFFNNAVFNNHVVNGGVSVARKAATFVVEVFNDMCDFGKEGFEKTLKLTPWLKLYDEVYHPDAPVFGKMQDTLSKFQRWLYATKFINSIANCWKMNETTRQKEFVGPLYNWSRDEGRFKFDFSFKANAIALLDTASFLDAGSFLREYHIYDFNYLVGLGQGWANATIPVLGWSVKNIPILDKIGSKPKEIFVFLGTGCQVVDQVKNEMWAGKPGRFSVEKLTKLGAGVGKLGLIGLSAFSKIKSHWGFCWYTLAAALTGSSGMTSFLTGQFYKRRDLKPMAV